MDTRRQDKVATLQQKVVERNVFVQEAKRATPAAGQRQLTQWAKKHKLTAFTTLALQGTQLVVEIDEAKQAEAALLDGCSVLETDVSLGRRWRPRPWMPGTGTCNGWNATSGR